MNAKAAEVRQEMDRWCRRVREWSGSAFLSGETKDRAEDERLRGFLYEDLCKLGNYLVGWQDDLAEIADPRNRNHTSPVGNGSSAPDASQASGTNHND